MMLKVPKSSPTLYTKKILKSLTTRVPCFLMERVRETNNKKGKLGKLQEILT